MMSTLGELEFQPKFQSSETTLAATDRETNEMDAFRPQTAEPSQEVPD
jgi:hypothetical protein